MKSLNQFLLLSLFGALTAHAQLAVTVSPVKIAGQKVVVPLALKNNLSEKVESARAVCFVLDEHGKMVGNVSRWVIGGQAEPAANAGLAPGATNAFNFVITSDKPFATTNLTAKVSFSRVVLEGGKVADVAKDVVVTPAAK
jgi:hypothetical protein